MWVLRRTNLATRDCGALDDVGGVAARTMQETALEAQVAGALDLLAKLKYTIDLQVINLKIRKCLQRASFQKNSDFQSEGL